MGLPTSLTPTSCNVARASDAAKAAAMSTASSQVGVWLAWSKLSTDHGKALPSGFWDRWAGWQLAKASNKIAPHVMKWCIIHANDGTLLRD